jgi:hypothetical protein
MTRAKKVAEPSKVITAYKGFDKDLKCRGFQYVIGQTYTHEGVVATCEGGFHACQHPLAVWGYYGVNNGNRFAVVEQDGETITDGDKTASQKITIKAEIGIPGLIKAAVEWTRERVTDATSGDSANSATSGYYARSATSGYYAHSATSGDSANSATSGYSAHSATSGNYAHSATSGDSANSATSGYYAHSATSGDSANSATSGYYARAEAKGNKAVAANAGDGAARAGVGGAIFIVERGRNLEILAVFASLVGQNGIKPDTWYRLKGGKPVEAAP